MLANIKREHPHMKCIVVQDALGCSYPNIKQLRELSFRFIISMKPKKGTLTADFIQNSEKELKEWTDESEGLHKIEWINNIPLNDTHYDEKVNYLEYHFVSAKGKKKFFAWITDIPLTRDNVERIMKAGRSGWRIENETFNTFKNHLLQADGMFC